jgi:hypothetical protein
MEKDVTNVDVCICRLPTPFHKFGRLVALASASHLTWYQSLGSQVRALGFAVSPKNYS